MIILIVILIIVLIRLRSDNNDDSNDNSNVVILIILIMIKLIVGERGSAPKRGWHSTIILFPPNASSQWQPDGLAIPAKKWFPGAGFLGGTSPFSYGARRGRGSEPRPSAESPLPPRSSEYRGSLLIFRAVCLGRNYGRARAITFFLYISDAIEIKSRNNDLYITQL